MKKKNKTIFICHSCGFESAKWLGKCPECNQWDVMSEELVSNTSGRKNRGVFKTAPAKPVPIDAVDLKDEKRLLTHIKEFDQVLGGGLVAGSLVLIGGDPGIGKSTLMLQVLNGIAKHNHKVLYVSGEESVKQIRLRSQRLEVGSSNLFVAAEIDLEIILAMIDSTKPVVVVIDSIQTMFSSDISSAPGSISQVRESALRLMRVSKETGIPIFLVGHVTKDGAIAGPRLLEHMVDTVLYFEGDRNHIFRILRAVKNRFGSTNEIGVFEMKEKGLLEVANPSKIFLSERPVKVAGSVVTASLEGTRPILIELQALVSSTNLGTPRRTILGLEHNRVALLVAVMEKKLGIHLTGHDIFMNVVGGVRVDEPAMDLAIMVAIASSFFDQCLDEATVIVGEVGLTGEVRGVGQMDKRISEAEKLGFTKILAPSSNLKQVTGIQSKAIKLIAIKNVTHAMEYLF